jgi:hypothetical protein
LNIKKTNLFYKKSTLKIFFLFCFFFLLLNLWCADLKIIVLDNKRIPISSSGFLECRMPQKQKDKRFILLGNSVLQTSYVGRDLLKRIEDSHLSVEIGNFSQVGTSIADYVFMYQHIKQFKPDLLLIHLCPTTFGHNWPLFRTDIKKAILKEEYRHFLKEELIRKHFEREELLESLLYNYLPCYRYLPFLRAFCKKELNSLCLKTAKVPLMDFFPYSTNTLEEWLYENLDQAVHADIATEYEDSSALFLFLLQMLEKDQQETIFVMQENKLIETPICKKIPHYLSGRSLFHYYDFRKYYNNKEDNDGIHPSKIDCEAIAFRLFTIIEHHLKTP